MGEPPRLTLKEAAHATGIPLDVLSKRVYRGTVPAEKIDCQHLIADDVVANLRTGGSTVSDVGETPDAGIAGDYIASLKGEVTFTRERLDYSRRELA
ncbi:MAG: hypothetical protein ACR2OO_10405 [Thermomicrobiales bacterium]